MKNMKNITKESKLLVELDELNKKKEWGHTLSFLRRKAEIKRRQRQSLPERLLRGAILGWLGVSYP